MRFVELCGGIGGFSLALQSEGFECVGYYEIDKYAVQTYNKNFGTKYEPKDIREIEADEINECEIICAGFPCQSFSLTGKKLGFKDTRGTIFFEIGRIAKERRPQILLLENVKGLLSHDNGRTFATILATLDELGYNAEWQVLNSKYFGVPQHRERVFIIGHLRGKPSRQIFPIRQDGQKDFILQTITARYFASNSNGNFICYPKKRREGLMRYDNYNQKFSDSDIAGTLKGAGISVQSSANLLVEKDKMRRLTPIECERLQGFPDDWTKGVSDSQRYKQIGNAVTISVVQRIAKEIKIRMGEILLC